jgi:hypothetical protein
VKNNTHRHAGVSYCNVNFSCNKLYRSQYKVGSQFEDSYRSSRLEAHTPDYIQLLDSACPRIFRHRNTSVPWVIVPLQFDQFFRFDDVCWLVHPVVDALAESLKSTGSGGFWRLPEETMTTHELHAKHYVG